MAHVLCPSLVGRTAELSRLQALLLAAPSQRPSVVFVSGEAGIGKSRLAREFEDHALAAGARVLRGRTAQMGTSVPFRPFAEALNNGLREGELETPQLEPYRGVLARLLPDAPDPGASAEPSLLAAMDAVRRLLVVMAGDGALVLSIEDVHWADADTLALIEYLSDNLADSSVLCICTERTDSDGLAAELVSALVARRAAEAIRLSPLGREDVRTMARLSLGTDDIPARVVELLEQRAAGSPFLVEELLSAYTASQGDAGGAAATEVAHSLAEALPPSYRELVRNRLAALPSDARRVVSAAAVMGRRFDWKLLGPATGLAEGEILEGLRAAVAAQVLSSSGEHFTTFGFRHALAREAILGELLPPERSELSLRAARAIEAVHVSVPGEWCERAAHLYEEGGDPLAAARLLQEAARRALSRSALAGAERALDRAEALSRSDWMLWMGVDDLLLDVLSRAGKSQRVVDLGTRLIAAFVERYGGVYAAARVADIHLRIARGVIPTADWETVRLHLGAARRLAADARDERLEVRVGATEALVALATGDVERAAELAAASAARASQLGDVEALCEALASHGEAAVRSGDTEGAREAFDRLAVAADRPELAVWRIRALLQLGTLDRLDRADVELLLVARSLATQTGAVSALAAIELEIGRGRLVRAELADAASSLERALEIGQLHTLALVPDVLVALATLHALRNDRAQMTAMAEVALGQGDDAGLRAELIAGGDAVLALAGGNDAAALAHLDRAAELDTERSKRWGGLRTLLAFSSPRGGEEHDLLDAARHADGAECGYAAYARAVVAGRAGRGADATSAFAEGDEAMPPGWQRHHARRVVADTAIQAGWGDPVRWANAALQFFEDMELPGFAAACRSTLRRAGAPLRRRGRGVSVVPRELHGLGVTSREMDVLHLVGERMSNREIGEQLFLSARTIETHVKNLVRKTGVGDRRGLVRLAKSHRVEPRPGPSSG